MLRTVSFISISIHHVVTSYWPYLNKNQQQSSQVQKFKDKPLEISDVLVKKINIIYENSMIGFMVGLSFFHLMPHSNIQIAQSLGLSNGNTSKVFPFGNLTAVFAFVFVLANSNYFYHANSKTKSPKVQNFRNRFQFQHEMLSNKKLKLRRRLAVQGFSTQIMISLPSIMLNSSLSAQNNLSLWFWCLIIILFEKHKLCQTFGRSFHAAGLQNKQALKLIIAHLIINWAYFICGCFIADLYPFMNGVLNGISCGVIMYDVMIQKLATNYEQKINLSQKILFLVSGIILSALIIQT